jgi:hypothetical protein
MKRELKKLIEKKTPYKVLCVYEPEVDNRCEPQVITIEVLVEKKPRKRF